MASAIKSLVMAWQYFTVSLPSCSVKSSALKEPPEAGLLFYVTLSVLWKHPFTRP